MWKRTKDVNVRRCAVEVLNNLKDPRTSEALMRAIKDSDWWVREKAIIALGKLKDKRAIAPLSELINDEEVKWAVPAVLAAIGGDQVIEPLKEFLFDEQKRVRIEAIRAFGKLKWNEKRRDARKE